MKKYFGFILFVLILSCDKIDSPLPEEYGKFDWSLYPLDPATYPYDITNPSSNWGLNSNPKAILLEDYTGHKCTNCPAAATIAKALEDNTSLNVIVASIHASSDGSFQASDNLFTNDYRTDAGDEYVSEMVGFIGNPMGTINRNNNSLSNTVWYAPSDWASAINDEQNNNLKANIQLQYNYYPFTNGLFIHTETTFLNDLTGNYHLVIYLIRDEIISPQKFNGGIIDTNYHHHSVLSDNINGTWGTSIIENTVSKDSVVYNNFSYELPEPALYPTYNIENLSLIAYVCDRNTYKVLQTIKTELSN